MNNGQVMLMDDFPSEEEQMLMAQGCYMEEGPDGRYYYDQDGNLAGFWDFVSKPFNAIDKALAKFDKAVISPVLKPTLAVVGKAITTVGNVATSPQILGMAAGLLGGKKPSGEELKTAFVGALSGAQPGQEMGPVSNQQFQSMIGNTAGMPQWLMQKTSVNVPANSPEMIQQAQQLAYGMDELKRQVRNEVGLPGPPMMTGPRPQPQTAGMDVGSLLKNPVVLGVGGLVLLKVLKVF
jgi:hypothetical protein